MVKINEQTRGEVQDLPGFRSRTAALGRPSRPAHVDASVTLSEEQFRYCVDCSGSGVIFFIEPFEDHAIDCPHCSGNGGWWTP